MQKLRMENYVTEKDLRKLFENDDSVLAVRESEGTMLFSIGALDEKGVDFVGTKIYKLPNPFEITSEGELDFEMTNDLRRAIILDKKRGPLYYLDLTAHLDEKYFEEEKRIQDTKSGEELVKALEELKKQHEYARKNAETWSALREQQRE